MLKLAILIFCALLQFPCQSAGQNKVNVKHDDAWKGCAEGFTIEEIESLFEKGKEPKDEKLRCVPKCVLTKLGFMDESNKINYEAISKESVDGISPEKIREVANNCKQPVDSDGCKAALAFMRCVVDKIKNW